MCGRFGRTKEVYSDEERWRAVVKMINDFGYRYVTYNASPKTWQPVITQSRPKELQFFTWGLVPRKSDTARPALPWFNARAETLLQTYPWKTVYPAQRCLVPADFFYEWPKVAGKPVKGGMPRLFKLANDSSFCFAGIWDAWKNPATGNWLPSFSIITTQPNELVASVHNRMPVILKKEDEPAWLEPSARLEDLQHLLRPYPAAEMLSFKVSTELGKVQNDYPGLCEPLNSL